MTGKGRKSKEVVHIRQILGGVLKTVRSDADAEMIEVWQIWERAVGDLIAGNTRPAAFKGKLLLVHASSSAWIHQLQFLKAELIEKLNAQLGRELVSDIKFKIGPVKSPQSE
jgi:predicted nucleic acid-binding Zn ribbon protein